MSVEVMTFGCRLNSVESEAMKNQAEAAGHDNLVIINTCAVTAEATRQARQAIRRLKREHPDKDILVTGCAAQIDPAMFAKMPEVKQVIGNHEKNKADTWIKLADPTQDAQKILVTDIMEIRETAEHLLDGFEGRTRAFVQIQNGCDHRCTFCIIPYGRGNSRSVPMGTIVEQIKHLVERGYKEVVLTGVDMTSWGADLPATPKLGHLVKAILKHTPDLPRLRLSSIDSIEADPDLIEAIAGDARVMPHLHLSLQAGDNMILKRMKRRHAREDSIAFCAALKKSRPDITFGADLIAGFPTETQEMFQKSLDLIDECDLTYLHIFPFSPREGTPAAKMPQLPKEIVRDRAKILREKGQERLTAFLAKQVGVQHKVLIEKNLLGRAENFAPVRFSTPQQQGQIVTTQISACNGQELVAAG
jgi:threonylcarbamoyladenosine tRNA methylthiotransferase MtaB